VDFPKKANNKKKMLFFTKKKGEKRDTREIKGNEKIEVKHGKSTPKKKKKKRRKKTIGCFCIPFARRFRQTKIHMFKICACFILLFRR